MAADYLHGVEFIEDKVSASIKVVKSGVIALVGIAPKGAKQTLTKVSNPKDAAQFGSELVGFTIPQALRAIFAQGNATVLVVNVLNDTDHLVQVTAEVQVVTGGKARLTYAPVKDLSLTNGAVTPVALVKDTDYSIDDYGRVTILSYTNVTEGGNIKATYKRLDASTVSSANIIGTIDGSNVRTGTKLFDLAYTLFGFKGKLFIAPGFSTINTVATELNALAEKFKGVGIIDAPIGTTLPVAIAGRGPAGAINFYRSGKRSLLCYPALLVYSPSSLANENRAFSQFLAGVISQNDFAEGYWVSPSNIEIKDIEGTEIPITFDIQDENCEANQLNEVGIITQANAFGTGIRTWGNRNASFPSDTTPFNFINVIRTSDVVNESIALAMMQYIDRNNITQASIDLVRNDVNNFINTLIGRGALLPGSVLTYNKDRNPANQLAAGNVVFTFKRMVPTPMERITFEEELDISLLELIG